ncbi:MAG: protein kinase, partial [Anaerolineae bacterium]|nr:protein kinase [Anaerolineae bacterium]
REVAVKVILAEYANLPDFIRQFETEAHLVARLEHPHIVPLFDYWRDSDGAYLVMRYLTGGSMRDKLKRGRFDPQEVGNLIQQIASALTLAHRAGVIHRDLKPDNILLDKENNAYLSDFGIAKDLLDTDYSTDNGALVGSLAYLSPEQLQGETATPQSDIYSLGITLFELLAGHHPFSDKPINALISCHLLEPIPLIAEEFPDLPVEVDIVIQQATAKVPSDRFHSASALAEAFSRAITGQTTLHLNNPDLNMLANPYKGLRTFEEADTRDFFGRETIINKILDLMSVTNPHSNFLTLIGPSGSGKSSLVNAGIIPALRQGAVEGSDKWFITQMYPGAYPFEEFEAVLARISVNPLDNLMRVLQEDERGLLRAVKHVLPADNSELLLIIDGFEEIFTLVEDESTRMRFLDALLVAILAPHSRLRVLILLRADYIDGPLRYAEFGNLINQRSEFILPLSADELERAIIEPAKRSGLQLEHGLTASIIRDVGKHPGGLPLLQYALTELYEMRRGRLLTLEAYRASGGVAGALARRAEQIFLGLDEKGQKATLQLFMRLVYISSGIEVALPVVTRTDLTSVGDSQTMESVIALFGKYRLLTFDRDKKTRLPTVELAHESLISEWERLQRWLDERREDLLLERWLMSITTEWLAAGKDSSYLSTGTRLERLESWVKSTDLELTNDEQAFIKASTYEQERQKDIDYERSNITQVLSREVTQSIRDLQGARRHATRRQRQLFTVSGIASIIMVLLISFVLIQNRNIMILEQISVSLQKALLARVLSAEDHQDDALKFAVEAANSQNTPTEALLTLEQIGYSPGVRHLFVDKGDPLYSVAVSADAHYAIVGTGRDNVDNNSFVPKNNFGLALWDLQKNTLIQHLDGHTESVYDVAFSKDNKTIYSASADKTIRHWQIGNPAENRIFANLDSSVLSLAISSDSQSLASGSEDGSLILWNTTTGDKICATSGNKSEIWDIAFSPDGKIIATGSGGKNVTSGELSDASITLWDKSTCHKIRQFIGHTNAVLSVAFSPDGSKLVSSSADHTAQIWDVNTGQELNHLIDQLDQVTVARFSPDGEYILTGSLDKTMILWDVASGSQIHRYINQSGGINDLAFVSIDQFISASTSGNLSVWDIGNALLKSHFKLGGGHTTQLDPTGSFALSGMPDGTIYAWDPKDGSLIAHYKKIKDGLGAVDALAIDPLGQFFVSAHNNYAMFSWSKTGIIQYQFIGHTGRIRDIAISPDDTKLVSASDDATIRLWDVHSGKQLGSQKILGEINALTFSRDSNSIFFSSTGINDPKGNILFSRWDIVNNAISNTYTEHKTNLIHIAISRDGKTLALAASDNTIIIWDIDSGKAINTLKALDSSITGLIFNPETNQLITGSSDQTVRTWNWETGEEQVRIDYGVPILNLDIDPKGKYILIGSTLHDAVGELQHLDSQDVISWVKQNRPLASKIFDMQ